MSISFDETIAAISTPIGEGGIGIVRMSGKDAIKITQNIFSGSRGKKLIENAKSHTIRHGRILDENGETIDEVLVSIFRSPNSYTSENMVEINAHGGIAAVRKILSLTLQHGARMAEPGEFTKRAFLSGRIDLTQAEAVLDTIRAKTDLQLKAAMAQLHGALKESVENIKNNLMRIYAHMEACLDFPDEHLEIYSNQDFARRYEKAAEEIESLIQSFSRGEIVREGVLTVIVGKPNVGKSSLLNAMLERERAIVSEIAGTTRDALEETTQIDGIPVRLVDTAGLFESEDPLVKAGAERTKQYLSEGDLFIFVLDAKQGFSIEDKSILNELSGKKTVLVVNKIDLLSTNGDGEAERLEKECLSQNNSVLWVSKPQLVSAKSKLGLDQLEKTLSDVLWSGRIDREPAIVTRLRHKHALETSLKALQKSKEAFTARESLEFVTFDLKRALDALREIVGEIYSEDLLDIIFKEFCIGK